MTLYEWAIRHNVPMSAIKDLELMFGITQPPGAPMSGLSEAAVQNNLRLEASHRDVWLFRNNVGGGTLDDGSFVRWGLANESSQVNALIKSGDLIGIRKLKITPQMVGYHVGQFVSREAKPGDWHYTGTEREKAQLRWIELINSLGGDAMFANGPGTL